MKKLLCALGVLLVTASAFGQGKQMNKNDVAITGDAASPTLVNNTDRSIIAYSVYWHGSVASYSELVTSFQEMRTGKPPMIPAHSRLTLMRDQQTQLASRDGGGENRITGARLEAVVFDDGEVVGIDPDMLDSVFERMDTRARAEKDLHGKLLKAYEQADRLVDKTQAKREKDAAWLDVKSTSERTKRRDFAATEFNYVQAQERLAAELLRVRDAPLGGEAAAIALAKGSQRYPQMWRKK